MTKQKVIHVLTRVEQLWEESKIQHAQLDTAAVVYIVPSFLESGLELRPPSLERGNLAVRIVDSRVVLNISFVTFVSSIEIEPPLCQRGQR